MVRRSVHADDGCILPAEDDLEQLICWSLEDSVAGAEPPPDVWPKILDRVKQLDAPAGAVPQGKRRVAFPVASLVQAVVVSALLLAFGLGIDQNVVTPGREHPVASTPTVRRLSVPQDGPNDILRGHVLLRMERESVANTHVGGYAVEVDALR
jgi:hypothetical protein